MKNSLIVLGYLLITTASALQHAPHKKKVSYFEILPEPVHNYCTQDWFGADTGDDTSTKNRLFDTIKTHGHHQLSQLLYFSGRNSDVINSIHDQITPLIFAIKDNCTFCIKSLIACPATIIETPTKAGYTAMHYACMGHNSSNCLRLLLTKTSNVNDKTINGDTPLHCAVAHNNPECVKVLLAQQNIEVNAQNRAGETPLHCAIIRRALSPQQLLLGHAKIDVTLKDNYGRNPLSYARHGEIEKAKKPAI